MENIYPEYKDLESRMQVIETEQPITAKVIIGEAIGVGDGKISAGEWSDERAELIKEGLETNLVSVSHDAPSCCIDGRTCTSCLDGEPTEPRHPVAGGALVTAYAAAEMTGWFGEESSTNRERLERVNRLLLASGIQTGAHCDETAVAVQFEDPATKQPKTGCGADDQLPKIIMTPYSSSEVTTQLSSALLREEFDSSSNVVISSEALNEQIAGWCPTDVIDVIGSQTSGNNIEILKSDDTPTHGHRESTVVLIYKEDITLDRDNFEAETNEQAFVINMPYIDRLAKAMAGGPHAATQYKQIKHAMVNYQVSTYLTLCDGSQRLVTVE